MMMMSVGNGKWEESDTSGEYIGSSNQNAATKALLCGYKYSVTAFPQRRKRSQLKKTECAHVSAFSALLQGWTKSHCKLAPRHDITLTTPRCHSQIGSLPLRVPNLIADGISGHHACPYSLSSDAPAPVPFIVKCVTYHHFTLQPSLTISLAPYCYSLALMAPSLCSQLRSKD